MNALLTWMLIMPAAGALLILLAPAARPGLYKGIGVATGLLTLLAALLLGHRFDPDMTAFQLVEYRTWIPAIGAAYHLGVDGMSLLLIALTTLLTPLALLGTWNSIRERARGFVIAVLLLESGMLGVFMARDLFLFYLFWEAMLIPMYLLVGIWGGPRRIYAAVKFLLYTLVGSFLLLVAILVLYFLHARVTGISTFDMALLDLFTVPAGLQMGLFLAFAFAFAIKVPLWPLHTWLPDAHVEAPTAGSVILAGVLLKMGGYGLLRFALPWFPEAAIAAMPYIAGLAIIGIIYGGLVAWVQHDIKSLVAYSSVAHLGFVVLGMFSFKAAGLSGSILQMINHGLSTGALFLLVGFLYERRHTRDINEFGGLATVMPLYAALLIVVALSSAALPGLNGFVGEFLILIGAYQASPWLAIPAVPGIVIAALYLLRLIKGVLFGPIRIEENRHLPDLKRHEVLSVIPLVLFIIWIGVYPKTFLKPLEPVAARIEARLASAREPTLPPRLEFPVVRVIPDSHPHPEQAAPEPAGGIQ